MFQFLLTHPVWDVTVITNADGDKTYISTHTSRVGCDDYVDVERGELVKFLLTHPVWDVTLMRKNSNAG